MPKKGKENRQRNYAKPLTNKNHEMFCVLYIRGGRYFFANAQNSYAEAYKYSKRLTEIESELQTAPSYLTKEQKESGEEILTIDELKAEQKMITQTCRISGSRLLSYVYIQERCNYLMDRYISNEVFDRELTKAALQDFDWRAKVSAVGEFNKLRNRVQNKLEGTFTFAWEGDDEKAHLSKTSTKVKSK